jgi:hypothetical protein
MTERMSLEEFRRRGFAAQAAVNKYSAEAVVVDGRRFDSKLEATRFTHWNQLWRARAIRWLLCQVPFMLPGGIVYRLDFMVLHLDGSLAFEDTKGVLTRVSINKIRQVEEIYGIHVELIQRERKKKCKARNTKMKRTTSAATTTTTPTHGAR